MQKGMTDTWGGIADGAGTRGRGFFLTPQLTAAWREGEAGVCKSVTLLSALWIGVERGRVRTSLPPD